MALINCPECNKEISDKAVACPHCGYPIEKIETNSEVSTQDFNNTEQEQAVTLIQDSDATSKNQKIMSTETTKKLNALLICGIILVSIILVFFIWNISANKLTGDDKTAYDIILNASENFKDPSSVRLVSGTLDGVCLYCGLSATNSFGARETSYYCIYSTGRTSDTSYPTEEYYDTESLNIDKINKKLAKELSYD